MGAAVIKIGLSLNRVGALQIACVCSHIYRTCKMGLITCLGGNGGGDGTVSISGEGRHVEFQLGGYVVLTWCHLKGLEPNPRVSVYGCDGHAIPCIC